MVCAPAERVVKQVRAADDETFSTALDDAGGRTTATASGGNSLWSGGAHALRSKLPTCRSVQRQATAAAAQEAVHWMVQRIHGDGRCLFRALAQGSHQRHGAPPLAFADETQTADKIRSQVRQGEDTI